MRGPGDHTGPDMTQPCPLDNTTRHVMSQVATFRFAGMLIHQESAREIAAWWQAPGNPFAPFQSTGHISDELDFEISHEISRTDDPYSIDALRALRAYVRACTVPVWAVGCNVAGYLPEGDVAAFTEYADAVVAYRDMIERAPDELYGDDVECTCDGHDAGGMCDFHVTEALVASFVADELPSVIGDRVFGTPRPLGLSIRPDHLPLPLVYWLQESTRVYEDLLAEKE